LLISHNKEIGRDLTEDELTIGMRKFLSNGDVFGVLAENRIIAMLNLYCNNYETLEAYICNVYVLEEYRGNHLASMMMKEAIELCKKRSFKSIHLHVAEDNVAAVNTYRKFGFEFSTEYKDNDIEMILKL